MRPPAGYRGEWMTFRQACDAAECGIALDILRQPVRLTVDEPEPAPIWERFTMRPDMEVRVWMLSAVFRPRGLPGTVAAESDVDK